jgi:hypothetical protein
VKITRGVVRFLRNPGCSFPFGSRQATSGNTARTTSRGERSKPVRQTNRPLPEVVQTLKITPTPREHARRDYHSVEQDPRAGRPARARRDHRPRSVRTTSPPRDSEEASHGLRRDRPAMCREPVFPSGDTGFRLGGFRDEATVFGPAVASAAIGERPPHSSSRNREGRHLPSSGRSRATPGRRQGPGTSVLRS